ncbi:peroxidase-related enzyme [Pseudoroseomonas cervicalis]|uniref:peroxidase-related enzyme n=1 Tax=Teichococcus cervicalis TaxID=204525 RepID=UPI002785591E|nr:peroxidase-related enzyme [Pseudoroseomonas cervicalis]MDQ1081695.1 putative peroxidase-related enzyme [Pseudoroseomonas cervicalis]
MPELPDTAPAETPPISWLDLPPAPPPGEALRALLARSRAALGYLRNGQAALLNRPELVLAQDALSQAVNRNPQSGLSPTERELIALVVSSENRCQPCVFGHAAALRGHTEDPFWVAQVTINHRHAGLSARERALADYALRITRDPGALEEADLAPLRAAGLRDIDILDAAAIAAYFNFSNRLNSALGVVPNREAYDAHRAVEAHAAQRAADHVSAHRAADHVSAQRTADHASAQRTADHVSAQRAAEHHTAPHPATTPIAQQATAAGGLRESPTP